MRYWTDMGLIEPQEGYESKLSLNVLTFFQGTLDCFAVWPSWVVVMANVISQLRVQILVVEINEANATKNTEGVEDV